MITKIYKLFRAGLVFCCAAAALTACSPEKFDGPNQAGIPSISGVDFNMDIDQSVNQATFTANLPAQTYAIWKINGNTYSTLNPMNWSNSKAGTYDVELRLGNRNGFSQGSISKQFTFENSQVDFTAYYTRISRTWRINYAEQGHMGCGEPGTDGSNWWSAAPGDKADWGVYDDRITFTAEGNYTYDPGEGGTVYVNNGSSLWPDYNTVTNPDGSKADFMAPVETQSAGYRFDVDGDKIVLILDDETLFPYISSDAQYANPVFTVTKLTNSEMVLLYEGEGITWRFMLTSKEDDAPKAFTGFKANSEFNMWKDITPVMSFYYNPDPGWGNEQTAAFEALFEGGDNNYNVTIPQECFAEWQAQVHFHTNLVTSAANHYDFSCILSTDCDIDGVVVKLTNEDDSEAIIDAHDVNLKAGDDYVFWLSDIEGKDLSPVKLVFDFGHATGETHVNIKNIVLKNHTDDDGTVLPTDNPNGPDNPEQPSVNWVAVDSPDNLGAGFNTAGVMSFWWADAGWSQVGDPGFAYANGVYTITAVENGGSEWQGQCSITGVPLNIEEGQAYDVRVKIVASDDLGRVTLKVNKDPDVTNDPNTLCYKGDFKLEAGENYLEMIGVVAKNGDELISFDQGKLILDFGGAPAGFEAKVSDIIIQKHKVVVDDSDPKAVDWSAYESADNVGFGFNTAGRMNFWWADANWNQVGDPEFSYADGVYDITAVENGGAEWQAQCSITDVPLKIEKGQMYDVSVDIETNMELSRVTVKVNKDPDIQNDPNTLCYKGDFILKDGKNVLQFAGVVAKNGDEEIEFDQAKMIFDFGGAPAGFEAKISRIIIQKHKVK